MKVKPKRIITSAKFGVSIYPNRYYSTSPCSKMGYVDVNVNDTVRLCVKEKDLIPSGGKVGGGAWQGNLI